MSGGPGPGDDRSRRLRRSLAQLAAAVVAVAVIALAAGWLLGRGDAPLAARLLLSTEVDREELVEDRPGPDPRVPTSGPQRGEPRCGVVDEPLSPRQQVEALAAGIVVVQHDALRDDDRARLRALVGDHERVLVAPADDLDAEVVATAWRHRLEQEALDVGQLEAFVVGWAGRGPDARSCPTPE